MILKKHLISLVQESYDLHVHIGPEIIARKYTIEKLIKESRGKIRGLVVKSHYFPTIPIIPQQTRGLDVIGSIVLNNFIGGLNTDAIEASYSIYQHPFIVWFPTLHATNSLDQEEYEINPARLDQKSKYMARKSKTINGISVLDSTNKLTNTALQVLRQIKKYNLILATGHLSYRESYALVKQASELKINKIIVSHPLHRYIQMPLNIQKEITKLGGLIEICYLYQKQSNLKSSDVVHSINYLGVDHCFLSSDVGQTNNPSPAQALLQLSVLLSKNGFDLNQLRTLLVTNPKKLLSI